MFLAYQLERTDSTTTSQVILESADAHIPMPRRKTALDIVNSLPQLIAFSANTQESLRQQILNHSAYLESHGDQVLDVAYTLNQRREHHVYRSFCIVGADGSVGKNAAIVKLPTSTPNPVMVFSGQGAQWPSMGAELILSNSGFRHDIEAMDRILQSLEYPPAWNIEGQ